jgi:hypothetical protein
MNDVRSMTGESSDTAGKLLALMLSVFSGVLVGVAAVFLQKVYSPFGVFPLIVGMLAGGATLLPLLSARRRGFILAVSAALIAALACTVTHHLGTFLLARREILEEAERVAAAYQALQKEMGGQRTAVVAADPTPIGLKEYYELQWQIGRPLGESTVNKGMLLAWWILDGMLVWLGASIVTVAFGTGSRSSAPPPPKKKIDTFD